ncbi:MAG: dihydrolipoyl dehydrogenase [Dysgonamonadaceae bacterium]|jgi:dihydrolipoamide dehydrogenase|nr:dihydrolipoyl dehydrogenase [Dysgonamonadaceae bacterium]
MIYDLAIIGGGPAGYTAAEAAGKKGLKTIVFEKRTFGGVCLNEGCIPTKTLLYSAKVYKTAKDASKYGISCDNVEYDLSKIIARKNKVVRKLVAGIRGKLTDAEVETIAGNAEIKSSDNNQVEISCNEETYIAKKLLICAGSETVIPNIPGIAETAIWTSSEALENKEVPESLIIVGGGVIGIEFASFFNVFGTKVTVIEMMDEILPGMDKELSALLRADLTKRGIDFHLETKVTALQQEGEKQKVTFEKDGMTFETETAKILLSVGRKPVMTGLGLENIQLETSRNGLKVNEYMQTSDSNIYACGDITGFSLLAHTAVREAEVAVEHLSGNKEKMSYKAIPGVVYTNPEIAGVGKTEEMLRSEGIQFTVNRLPMAYAGRFVAENEQVNGVCKILKGEDGTILGVHILGNPASEIITIAGIAIEKKMKADELKAIVFPHPTVGEIIKETL